jgi:2-dehydropantoate 2-reductase
MKIAIVGVGAMGSVYAALLASAGHEVWGIDGWGEHVAAINAKGLTLTGASGERTVRLRATTRAGDVGPCDLVIVATKAANVLQAADAARSLLKSGTTVLTIQNGLGSAEKVAGALGSERVAIGVVGGFGASIRGPGEAHHNGMELVRLGELDGPVTPRLEAVAEVWRSGGFTVKTFDDIHQMIWEKLICNVGFSGPCALTGVTVGQLMADPDGWAVASGCASEAWRVAKAKGVKVEIDEPVAYLRAFGEKVPGARPSMLLDHLAGRASEVDAINGAIPPAAASVGLEAPLNTAVASLIRAKERGMLAQSAPSRA